MKNLFNAAILSVFLLFTATQSFAIVPKNLGDQLVVKNLRPNATIAANEDSSAIDLMGMEGQILLMIDSSASVAGTLPTLALKLTHCDTSGGSYTDVSGGGLVAQAAIAKAQTLVLNKNNLKRYVKLNAVIGGTDTPQFYMGAKIVGMNRVQ